MKYLLLALAVAVACVAGAYSADPYKLQSEVKTVSEGDVQGTWMTTKYGVLAACHKHGRVEFPFVVAYKKGEENKLPYAMRFDNDTGELLLQMPGETNEKTLFIPVKHIYSLVEASLKVRHAGEYWSGDPVPKAE